MEKQLDSKFIEEATKRLKILKLDENIINDLKNENIIYVSEANGNIRKANNKELELINKFEQNEKNKITIFHIIHESTKYADVRYFLYIYGSENDWKLERRDLKLGYALCICYKETKDIHEIGIDTKNGKVMLYRNYN